MWYVELEVTFLLNVAETYKPLCYSRNVTTSDLGCFLYDLDITDEIVTSQPLLSCSVRAA